jgi:hypothetical protein
MENSEQLLCRLMDMSQQDYRNFFFESAMEWIEFSTPTDKRGQEILAATPSFWAYWANQWEKRNQQLIKSMALEAFHFIISPADRAIVREAFVDTHHIDVTHVLRLNSIVIQEWYTRHNKEVCAKVY